ncbi:hypothetical protein XPN_2385 [Xanthomonas arboricola pv. pruni MAFF 301427]|nr:hypothetical protein XPN_2385 [Xanthomonas arboricola pv. pruni MAFF 301427]
MDVLLLRLFEHLLADLGLLNGFGLLKVLLRRFLCGLAAIDMGMKHWRDSHPMWRVDRKDIVCPVSA